MGLHTMDCFQIQDPLELSVKNLGWRTYGGERQRESEKKKEQSFEAKALSAPVVGTQASLRVHDTPIPDWDARRMHRPPLRPHW